MVAKEPLRNSELESDKDFMKGQVGGDGETTMLLCFDR